MDEYQYLAERFEEHRARLRAVAYRMLGSMAEAEDAVQDTWERVSRAGADDVDNLAGWLTTIVARVCLNMLRSRNLRGEQFFGTQIPDPVITLDPGPQPEDEAVLADSVSLALLVVLDTLSPSERLAFVLHDMFQLPYEEIAPMIERSPDAARQLASRARRRVAGAEVPSLDQDLAHQREVVDAFFAAARQGEFDDLVKLLHPDVVLRANFGKRRPPQVHRGAETVAAQSLRGAIPTADITPALVNGAPGAVITVKRRPWSVMGFTVRGGKIIEIDAIADPERVGRIASRILDLQ